MYAYVHIISLKSIIPGHYSVSLCIFSIYVLQCHCALDISCSILLGYYERFQALCNLQPVRCHRCLLQVVLRWLMYTSCTAQVEVLKVAATT